MTEKINKKTGEITNLATTLHPSLDEKGREMPSNVSLVTVANRRPISLGQRIARYTTLPELRDELFDEIKDEEYVGDYDGPPMSPHEDRHSDLLASVKKKRDEKLEADKKAQAEKIRLETEEFRKKVLAIKNAGAEPAPPPPPSGE